MEAQEVVPCGGGAWRRGEEFEGAARRAAASGLPETDAAKPARATLAAASKRCQEARRGVARLRTIAGRRVREQTRKRPAEVAAAQAENFTRDRRVLARLRTPELSGWLFGLVPGPHRRDALPKDHRARNSRSRRRLHPRAQSQPRHGARRSARVSRGRYHPRRARIGAEESVKKGPGGIETRRSWRSGDIAWFAECARLSAVNPAPNAATTSAAWCRTLPVSFAPPRPLERGEPTLLWFRRELWRRPHPACRRILNLRRADSFLRPAIAGVRFRSQVGARFS